MDRLICDEATAWAAAHGLLMVAAEDMGHRKNGSLVTHAPMSMVPTKMSKQAFELAMQLAQPFGVLVDKIARDTAWVYEKLEPVLKYDEFTANLVALSKAVEQEGIAQEYYLGIHRSDYMLDGGIRLLQVELNTIASSFGCLSARVSRMHRFLMQRYETEIKTKLDFYGEDTSGEIAENLADTAIPKALAVAAKLQYKEQNLVDEGTPFVLFVVQDGERNSFDQRWLEYELWKVHKVATMRRSLGYVAANATLNEKRSLVVDGKTISVVYFRAGYTPNDYPTQAQWDGRTLLERSNAIKCPSIAYHLVGTKKIQQELATPGAIERFMDEENTKLLRSCFAGLWTLDYEHMDDSAKEAIQDAIQHPEKYVIKPQREGGGNNIYGTKVKTTLETMPQSEQASYILMQRIFPQEVDAYLVRGGNFDKVKALQELGVYNTFLGNGKSIELNEKAGHLLRTKQVGVDEGGVATGYSCLDSPYLV